jgi:hypothetical protein
MPSEGYTARHLQQTASPAAASTVVPKGAARFREEGKGPADQTITSRRTKRKLGFSRVMMR